MLLRRSSRPLTLLSNKLQLRPLPHQLQLLTPTRPAPLLPLPLSRSFHLSLPRLSIPLTPLSTVSGPLTPPLLNQTLGSFWDQQVSLYPSSLALVCRHEVPNQHALDSPPGHKVGEGEGECLRWSYEQMGEHVDALARGLSRRGVKKGDRVAVVLGNGSAYALLQWATAKIGAILVCINPSSSSSELLSALNLTTSSTLLISPTLRGRPFLPVLHSLFPSLSRTPADEELKEEGCEALKRVVLVDNTDLGAKGFGTLLESEGVGKGRDFRSLFKWEGVGVEGTEECRPDEIVNFQFTSGTTGLPKAVALTHSNVLNNGLFIGRCMALRPPAPMEGWEGERLVNSPPAFHCFGLVLGNLALWTHGGCVIYASESFSPSLALRAAHLERATALHGVPTMFIAELALLRKLEEGEWVEGLSDLLPEGGKGGARRLEFGSLRTGIAAGSPVPDEVMRSMVERMNLKDLTITYGMSETSPATCMSTTHDPLPLRCHTVGRVLPHTHLRIVSPSHPLYPSPETPSVPLGEAGELWSGGYAVMEGYWRNERASREVMFDATLPDEEVEARRKLGGQEVMVDGEKQELAPAKLEERIRWIRTGDQATMDPQGYVRIVGRIKDIIIRGGENLFPVVIEARMLKLVGVEDCSIISVPHPLMGEVVGAFIQRSPSSAGRALTSTRVREHITELLGHQSAPDWVWYLGEEGVEEAYPVTQSGKIRKVELREWGKKLAEQGIGKARMD